MPLEFWNWLQQIRYLHITLFFAQHGSQTCCFLKKRLLCFLWTYMSFKLLFLLNVTIGVFWKASFSAASEASSTDKARVNRKFGLAAHWFNGFFWRQLPGMQEQNVADKNLVDSIYIILKFRFLSDYLSKIFTGSWPVLLNSRQ